MGPKKRYVEEKIKHIITAGVRDDFEELLQRFTATETVRYESFAEIWREMRMPFIFAGRQNEREAREFAEECLKIAAQYTMSPYHFQVRVGALYLMYAVFHTQPCILKGMIRMTPEMWHDLMEFQNEAHRQQHLDVDFIFHKLRTHNAFNFVATVNEMSYSREGPDEDVSLPDELTEDQSALFDIFSTEVLEELATVHKHYHTIKVALEGPEASAPSKSLSVIKPELISNITQAIVTYQDRRKPAYSRLKKQNKRSGDDTDGEDESEEDDESGGETYKPGLTSKKSKLKAKAFQNVSKATKSRRHRQAKKAGHTVVSSTEGEQETENESSSNVAMDTSVKQELDAADAGGDITQEFFNMPLVTATEESSEKPTKTRGKGKGKKTVTKAPKTPKTVSSEDENMTSPGEKSATKRKSSSKMPSKSPPSKESPSPTKKTQSPRKFTPLSDVLPKVKGKKKSKGKKS